LLFDIRYGIMQYLEFRGARLIGKEWQVRLIFRGFCKATNKVGEIIVSDSLAIQVH